MLDLLCCTAINKTIQISEPCFLIQLLFQVCSRKVLMTVSVWKLLQRTSCQTKGELLDVLMATRDRTLKEVKQFAFARTHTDTHKRDATKHFLTLYHSLFAPTLLPRTRLRPNLMQQAVRGESNSLGPNVEERGNTSS